MSKGPLPPMPGEEPMFSASIHNDDGLRSINLQLNPNALPASGDTTTPVSPTSADTEPVVAMSVADRAEMLNMALGYVAGISMREGFGAANQLPGLRKGMVKRYQGESHADGMVEGAEHNKNLNKNKLDALFPQLFGAKLMIDGALRTPEQSEEETSKYYQAFLGKYSGAAGEAARTDDRFLADRAAGIITRNKRNNKLTKDRTPKQELLLTMSFPNDPSDAEVELPKATQLLKLRALRDDPRAGFIPGEHIETTEGSVLLDYIGDDLGDQTDRGVHNHLREVYRHQEKVMNVRKQELKAQKLLTPDEFAELKSLSAHHIKDVANRAHKSVGVSYFDFYDNATRQGEGLSTLRELLGGQSPRITIAEALEDVDDPALRKTYEAACASLVQFVDVRRYRDREIAPTTYSLLYSVEEDRDNQTHPEKNKSIIDCYNAREKSDEVESRIAQYVKTQKLGDVMKVLEDAIENQTKRAAFWSAVLDMTTGTVKRVVTELRETR